MSLSIKEQIDALLDIGDQDLLIQEIAKVKDEKILYALGCSYNWDDGFAVPTAIIANSNCHLSTALMLFYLADGGRYLANKPEVEKSTLSSWKQFIMNLYNKIIAGTFDKSNIKFVPPFNKVGLYKLRKQLNDSELIFIEPIDGEDLEHI